MTRSSPTNFHRAPRRRLVAGCGALGMRVARRWLAAGDAVWGTTRCRHEQLAEAGIVLGEDYPNPIVDHAEARQTALNAYELIKKNSAA